MTTSPGFLDAVLCYVRHGHAYFTTQPLASQWGDDWNDAPYEHNAGEPYAWREGDKGPPYHVLIVGYRGPFETPEDRAYSGNSQFSVQSINNGHVAWLLPDEASKPAIVAGTTLRDFVRLVREAGGEALVPLDVAEELLASERR